MEVPEGFEEYYPPNVLLLLLQTIYGLKQAAMAFFRELKKAMDSMGFKQSKADPCLHYNWTMKGLIVWLSWIDDCLVLGEEQGVLAAKEQMKQRFDCDDLGELDEYLGCKIERGEDYFRITQPVLLQSFIDEFGVSSASRTRLPAAAGTVLMKSEDSELVGEALTKYRSGTGKMLHMMRWSRPEIYNSVRELSRFMTNGASEAHVKAMHRVMEYCVSTKNRGLTLRPNVKYDGDPEFELVILGRSDSDFAKDPDTRRSVSGNSTFLCGAPIMQRSGMQRINALSVTEAELFSAVENIQDMMYCKRIVESMRFRVQLPMILEMDNKGAIDLVNNFSVGGRTRHIETRQYYLRELKNEGILAMKWISNEKMSSDIFTKNVVQRDFDKHAKT